MLPCYVVPYNHGPIRSNAMCFGKMLMCQGRPMCLPGFVEPIHHGQHLPIGDPKWCTFNISAVASSHIAMVPQAVDSWAC